MLLANLEVCSLGERNTYCKVGAIEPVPGRKKSLSYRSIV